MTLNTMSREAQANQPSLERRPALESDADFAREVHHEAYRSVVVRQFGNWDEERQNRYFARDWGNGENFEIITYNGEPCGYCRFDYLPDQIVGHELVISPKFQGKGIGSKILREVIEVSNQKQIPIRIGALKENKALALYRRLGFKDEDSNDTHIGFRYDPE